ncbi:MAG: NapC/NirT family cytochrome c [Planctomycetes bacterium]|nr:NapC/NirT family cytochrome c [Planctomycetota bacterium]
MSVRRRLSRLRERMLRIFGTLLLVGLFGGAAAALVLYTAVHHTAQPQFCNSCHIMEPYYQSWQRSVHHDVACIECHYEPGAVETAEGKFKALSQVAKYVTRTQGTKPWAEVSDQSCMRSGCHSVRALEGRVQFGRVSFDHTQHLLESQRGRRLRCVTCHSGDPGGVHIAVSKATCFACHFKPGEDGKAPEKQSDCLLCHGPPKEPVLVDGRAFVHDPYVARGVNCRECHNPVIQGDGQVRKERCHSCHTEVGHVERIGEKAFLHEMHVTEHKVECFECHDEIQHGLLPLQKPGPAKSEGCGACHANSHDAALEMYSGTGALEVADRPSRMYQTRVVCAACHTGRTGYLAQTEQHTPAHVAHAAGAAGVVAAAGNADCIHCHGTSYDGLLGQWKAAVGEQLERLEPLAAELAKELETKKSAPAYAALQDAKHNLLLVALDGSHGVHNVSYALDALRVSAAKIDSARELIGAPAAVPAVEGFPFESKQGCTTCHAGAGRPDTIWPPEKVFPHQRHLLKAGLDCDACHSTTEHGKPAFPRSECASCHHKEPAEGDAPGVRELPHGAASDADRQDLGLPRQARRDVGDGMQRVPRRHPRDRASQAELVRPVPQARLRRHVPRLAEGARRARGEPGAGAGKARAEPRPRGARARARGARSREEGRLGRRTQLRDRQGAARGGARKPGAPIVEYGASPILPLTPAPAAAWSGRGVSGRIGLAPYSTIAAPLGASVPEPDSPTARCARSAKREAATLASDPAVRRAAVRLIGERGTARDCAAPEHGLETPMPTTP